MAKKSKIKYFRQSPNTSVCTPLAVLNALRGVGVDVNKSSDVYKQIKEDLGFLPGSGVYCNPEGRILRKLGFNVKLRTSLTVTQLDKELKKGRHIVFTYRSKYGNHTILLIGTTKKCFTTVNDSLKATTIAYKWKSSFRKCFKKYKFPVNYKLVTNYAAIITGKK